MKKPTGQFKCRACGEIWDGSQLYEDPRRHMWTCGNLFCGGTVDKLPDATTEKEGASDAATL